MQTPTRAICIGRRFSFPFCPPVSQRSPRACVDIVMTDSAQHVNTPAVVQIGSTQVVSKSAPDDEKQRFEVELEFVQCLANPAYLNFLAQNEYLDSDDFIAYLKYLEYWRRPEYARFIVFPQALYFLRLLQQPPFREALKRPDYSLMLHQQQGFHWQFESRWKKS